MAVEDEYHADLHENAERDNPESGSGRRRVAMHCCVNTNKYLQLTYFE